MGLAVGIAVLQDLCENDPEGEQWLHKGLDEANRLLCAAGYVRHDEPRVLPRLQSRAPINGFPYSFLHYLRRAYARRRADPNWVATPLSDGDDPCNDVVLTEAYDDLDSHLLCHSDAEGYYFPVKFREVIFADTQDSPLPGGMLGSSYRLLEELIDVAPALGIALDAGHLSDEEANRIAGQCDDDTGIYRELIVWLALFESARLSIEHKTAIVFS